MSSEDTVDLVGSLERHLRSQRKLDSWNPSKVHVSDLSVSIPQPDGKCPRALWLRVRGADSRQPKFGELLMWENGARMHREAIPMLMKGMPRGWRVLAVEASIAHYMPKGIDSGTVDLVLRGPGGDYVVVDFKTRRSDAFHNLNSPSLPDSLQVSAYGMALDASYQLLVYLDREGQNGARQFRVDRNDEWVMDAVKKTLDIVGQKKPPPVLLPVIQIRENAGPASVKVKVPWQCEYCVFRDVSCPGAIPRELEFSRVIGHIKEGEFVPVGGAPDELVSLVKDTLQGEEGEG